MVSEHKSTANIPKKAKKAATTKKAQTKANKTEIKVKNVKTQNENHFKVNKKYVSAK